MREKSHKNGRLYFCEFHEYQWLKACHDSPPKVNVKFLYLALPSYHLKRSTIIRGPLNFGGNIHSICVTTFTHLGGKLPALSGKRNRRSLSAWSRLQCNQFLDLPVMTQQIQQYLVCLCQIGMLCGT